MGIDQNLRAYRWVLCLLWVCVVSVGCRDQQASEEEGEDLGQTTADATTAEDVATGEDTATVEDAATGEDTATAEDAATGEDTATAEDSADAGEDADAVTSPCVGPPRVEPATAHGSGGALVTLRGAEFYIGALWWCMGLEDAAGQLYVVGGEVYATEVQTGQCEVSFLVPPLPPGEYKVSASYGCAFGDGDPRDGAFGTLTIASPQEMSSQAVRCSEASPCALSYERCHPDLSICVGDICQFGGCYTDPRQPPVQDMCALVTGCVPPAQQCVTADDCRIAAVGCGCIGVHSDDPRAYGDECFLGGCVDCDPPPCSDRYKVSCDGGLCGLRPLTP
jgi:hypothetical protein